MAHNRNLHTVKTNRKEVQQVERVSLEDIIQVSTSEAIQIAAAHWQAQQAEQNLQALVTRRQQLMDAILQKYAPKGDDDYNYSMDSGTFTRKPKQGQPPVEPSSEGTSKD